MDRNEKEIARPKPELTLFRSVCIIVGIIVGSGIFESPPDIASNVTGWWGLRPGFWVLFVWILAGLFSMIGALCYAELATAYPQEGGDYVYLNRAFGRWSGFLFGWARLAIIQGGSLGAMAYVFGDYATRLLPLGVHSPAIYAASATVVLTLINMIGVREGTLTQNILTGAKVIGLGAIFVVAFLFEPSRVAQQATPSPAVSGFGLAMILALWTYGGWNEIAYVAAEVKDPRRNIFRSLVLGILAVTLIYAFVNAAFLHSLGFEGLRNSRAVASDVLAIGFGELGAKAIAALVVVSALGALNGLIFTSPRVYYAMGAEHRLLAPLGKWSPRFGTPLAALAVQCVIILALIVGFGSREGFQTMVKFTSAAFWGFLLLTGFAFFVLRYKDRHIERPCRVIGYPLVPVLFILTSAYMFYASATYAPKESLVGGAILLVGLPIYGISLLVERLGRGSD